MESYSIEDLENKLKQDKTELLEIEALLEEDNNDDELQTLKNDLITIIKTTTDLIIKKQREKETNNIINNVTTPINSTSVAVNNTNNNNSNNNFNSSSEFKNNNIIIPPPTINKKSTFNDNDNNNIPSNIIEDNSFSETKMTVGSVCEGQYSVDGIWYRAKIDSINKDGTFVVTYTDYGNTETLTFDKIRPPTRSLKLLANQTLEQKKYLQAPDQIQVIPKSLKILPEDSEEVKKQKQKKIHSIKSMNRLKKVEEEGKQKTQAWKDFVNKPKKSIPGTFTDRKKTSMFSTGDGIHSKVGVIGSGRGMTESQQFQSLAKKSSSIYP
ncbi:hypothetical protein DDB_G0293636 [Dictyostelium discoideum AX4]|uniref:Tudor domain-containing protein n=1 Tax=Dictyostelium discoideum TaxID=44689 RepID=Q54BG2_DICDI|nr:hypothetical protein DDB_G0293636 [Dictyostelium discoideum AX4]EAL60630.1 hypothetical protein DDB_G0293636 [Dictyostelium discoideum AX4]|eukprot:XP_629067.1 hypothetical protein DDB_G0293636 [Dictyostelium discoideum AX4]